MIRLGNQLSLAKRGLCLNAAISFLFFLVFSAPHRVHHYFEQTSLPTAHHIIYADAHNHSDGNDRDPHDKSQPVSKQSDCIVLSVSQAAHLSLVTLFSFPIFKGTAARCDNHRATSVASRHSSPASPRAPPQL